MFGTVVTFLFIFWFQSMRALLVANAKTFKGFLPKRVFFFAIKRLTNLDAASNIKSLRQAYCLKV